MCPQKSVWLLECAIWFVAEFSSFATALTIRFSFGLLSFGLYDVLVLTET